MIFSTEANSGRKLTFSGFFATIITVNGPQSDTFGAFFVQGYWSGSARNHIATIHAGPSVTCTISEDEEGIFIKNATVGAYVIIFMLQGSLPVITTG